MEAQAGQNDWPSTIKNIRLLRKVFFNKTNEKEQSKVLLLILRRWIVRGVHIPHRTLSFNFSWLEHISPWSY
jgi:hypothetical protein